MLITDRVTWVGESLCALFCEKSWNQGEIETLCSEESLDGCFSSHWWSTSDKLFSQQFVLKTTQRNPSPQRGKTESHFDWLGYFWKLTKNAPREGRKRERAHTPTCCEWATERGLLLFEKKTQKNCRKKTRELLQKMLGFANNRNPKKWFCPKCRAPSDFCFSRPGKSTLTALIAISL